MNKFIVAILLLIVSSQALADFEIKGWFPRYVYLDDDKMLGRTHYAGVSYFKRQGNIHEGPTLRYAYGEDGQKINLAYTSGVSFLGVDMGISYVDLDRDNYFYRDNKLRGVGLELGLRLWAVQLIGLHTDVYSSVSLGYGF